MNFTEERMNAVYMAATQVETVLNQIDERTPGYDDLVSALALLERAIVEYEDSIFPC